MTRPNALLSEIPPTSNRSNIVTSEQRRDIGLRGDDTPVHHNKYSPASQNGLTDGNGPIENGGQAGYVANAANAVHGANGVNGVQGAGDTDKRDEESRMRRRLAHYLGLVLASMIGCLIRLGLTGLSAYDGRIIFPLAWSQGVGCAIMGLALGQKAEISSIYPPLYTFITTGIAGSVTTFSSWMLEGYLSFANFENANRTGFHDTVDGFAYSFSTWLISLGGLHVGTHFAKITSPFLSKALSKGNRSSSEYNLGDSLDRKLQEHKSQRHVYDRSNRPTPYLDYLTISSAFVSYLIALLLYFFAPVTWRHRATFPILLSPPGAMLRYFLSTYNSRSPFANKFPIGTFAANISATLIDAGVFSAQRLPSAAGLAGGGRGVRCNTLWAFQQGFCGCFSTVSTFVVESKTIKRKRWTWIYIGGTVVLGHLCVLGVVGGVGWTRGYVPVCTE